MAKVTKVERISKKEQDNLIFDLIHALVQTKTINDVALFLQDLLTLSEMKILSKRLRIAKLLLAGMTYQEIEENLHVSHGTIAKIAVWLSERGEGFRKTIQKIPSTGENRFLQELTEWDQIKRKYSMYFWPELLLEEIVKNANHKQRERIKNVLKTLEDKNELHRRLEKLLRA